MASTTFTSDIDSIEVPILDGSAEPFLQMLELAGIRKLRRMTAAISKSWRPLEVSKATGASAFIRDEFRVRCYVDFRTAGGPARGGNAGQPADLPASFGAPRTFASSATSSRCARWD